MKIGSEEATARQGIVCSHADWQPILCVVTVVMKQTIS